MKNYHPIASRITELLRSTNRWFETFTHEEVLTSEEAAKTRPGYSIHQGAKAIILRVKPLKGEKYFIMLVLPADRRFNSQKIKDYLSAKDVRFASEAELDEITGGVKTGAVPPFGNMFGLKVVVDTELIKNQKIVFNAGDRCFSLAMQSNDYVDLVKPVVLSIV